MHLEHRFSDLTESLRNGFIVDDIVLALARAEKGEPLKEKDLNRLQEAVAFLDKAEAGYRWLDKPELADNTSLHAAFFGQAVAALPEVHEPGAFLDSISDLKATASQLSIGEALPPAEKIRLLRTFFYNAAKSELERTERLLGESGSSDASKWMVTGE